MTEDEAQAWLTDTLHVSRETLARLDAFRGMVIEENERQNLVSSGSIGQLWARHIVDSAQLLLFPSRLREGLGVGDLCAGDSGPPPAPPARGRGVTGSANTASASPRLRVNDNWLDLGTGAGFPGIVIAILQNTPITMVESRRLRVEFLERAKSELGLNHATILCSKLETLSPTPYSVISARAFAPLHRLLPLAHSFSTAETMWLLPKGRKAREEIKSVEKDWRGVFHVEQSLTDPESAIIIAQGISPRRGQRKY